MSQEDKDFGWKFLFPEDSSEQEDNEIFSGENGSWGYKNSDGSAYYSAEDGSWGYRNSDGSAYYSDKDGSWGIREKDGSGSYSGKDGTWGYKESDGSEYYSSKRSADFSDVQDELDMGEEEIFEEKGQLLGTGIVSGYDQVKNIFRGIQSGEVVMESDLKEASDFEWDDEGEDDDDEEDDNEDLSYEIGRLLGVGIALGVESIKNRTRDKKKVHSQIQAITSIQNKENLVQGQGEEESKIQEDQVLAKGNIENEIQVQRNVPIKKEDCEKTENIITYRQEKVNRISNKDVVRKKKWYIPIMVLMAIVFICLGIYKFEEYRKMTVVGISSVEAMGESYEYVVEILKKSGFVDIRLKEEEDLEYSEVFKEGTVKQISIDDNSTFAANSKFANDVRIVITYHKLKKISPPLTSKKAKGENYEDVLEAFKNAGFVNVSLEVEYDLVTGWITGDGEVEQITIDGNKKYKSSSKFRPDVEVVILYHTFKKNKK